MADISRDSVVVVVVVARTYAPTSDTTSHDIHEKINSWLSFLSVLYTKAAWVHIKHNNHLL